MFSDSSQSIYNPLPLQTVPLPVLLQTAGSV